MAEDFGKLTSDIVTSYNVRIMGLETIADGTRALAKDTQGMLKRFHAEHQDMSARQAKALGGFMSGLKKNVSALLARFQSEHQGMSAEQAKALAGFMSGLTANLGKLMKKFQKEHQIMTAGLDVDAAALKKSLAKSTLDLGTSVKHWLQEFSDAHAEMSEGLKKDLAKYVAELVNGTQGLLGEFLGDREKMAAHWQAMATTLARKRSAAPVKVAGARTVKTVKQAVRKPAARKAATKARGKKS
jgi:galactose-1-phosphate uridylyltransferase